MMRRLWSWLLPELQRFPAQERGAALARARATELDILELVGISFGLVLVTAATQYALPDASSSSRLAAALLNFAVALPLMALVVAPFHIRRLRRGLDAQLELRSSHD